MSILLIFLDGVGIGRNDPSSNPFALSESLLSRFTNEADAGLPSQFRKKMSNDISVMQAIVESDADKKQPSFRAIFSKYCDCLRSHEREYMQGCGEKKEDSQKREKKKTESKSETFRAIDARLGVPGIPQSATGQASLLTGLNVPKGAGGHCAGLPGQAVREILRRESIFLRLSREGLKVSFTNAFTEAFFKRERPRISATTESALAAGLRLRTIEDVKAGRALYHDFSNFFLREMEYDLDLYSPKKAGKILADMASENDFTLYEYFITDIMGHKGGLKEASIEVAKIDLFLRSVLAKLDLQKHLVIVTSDHGNLEDISLKTHTLNNVPLLCFGKGSRKFASAVKDISDITPHIINFIS